MFGMSFNKYNPSNWETEKVQTRIKSGTAIICGACRHVIEEEDKVCGTCGLYLKEGIRPDNNIVSSSVRQ